MDPLAERHKERAEQADAKTFNVVRRSVHGRNGRWLEISRTSQAVVPGHEHVCLSRPSGICPCPTSALAMLSAYCFRFGQPVTPQQRAYSGRIEMVLSWAKANGYRRGENPAAWKDNLQHTLPKPSHINGQQKHYAALPYGEIGSFVAALREKPGTGPRALEFCILSATRTTEARMAKWEEFDADLTVWTIPAERTKMRRELRVPLTDAARAILVQMRDARVDGGEFVFPGKSDRAYLSEKALLRVLHRMGVTTTSVHGFRSTFSDWCSETTSHPEAVREMALGHAIENRVAAAYRRGDLFEKRRMLMADWANYCATPRQDATVVDIRRATA